MYIYIYITILLYVIYLYIYVYYHAVFLVLNTPRETPKRPDLQHLILGGVLNVKIPMLIFNKLLSTCLSCFEVSLGC